ncbi:MAG: serine/threonine protein kinase [Planctomycetes bacterium]|nr:serine/threonine protein kinase [Planctomycetota bacterium]
MKRFLDFIFFRGKKRYGGYELLEEIARGGMSHIWKARQPETGKLCALKILTPESVGTQDRFKKLFESEEGAIALRLSHKNVIETFDFGRGSQDEYYIAMEYVNGPNLEALIVVESPRVRRNRFELLMQMAQGLAYIHEQSLIHRDFCPKNVLLGSDGVVKIIDFGLCIPAGVHSRALITRAGTASYMAPEQVRNQQVDVRTDIYAYGVSAYEVLTFRKPFNLSGDRQRKMQTHLNVPPLPLRDLEPGLPDELDDVLRKCIAKDRNMRYKSMNEAIEDLQAAIEIARAEPGEQ